MKAWSRNFFLPQGKIRHADDFLWTYDETWAFRPPITSQVKLLIQGSSREFCSYFRTPVMKPFTDYCYKKLFVIQIWYWKDFFSILRIRFCIQTDTSIKSK